MPLLSILELRSLCHLAGLCEDTRPRPFSKTHHVSQSSLVTLVTRVTLVSTGGRADAAAALKAAEEARNAEQKAPRRKCPLMSASDQLAESDQIGG